MADDLAFTPAWQLRDLVAARKVSPVELTELLLRRIDALNPKTNAYLTVAAEEALEAARRAETDVVRGDTPLGPLHGVPISIKDLYWVKGVRSTGGSLVYQEFRPTEDAALTERARKAGAIILGKTNTPEFGLSGTTENRLADACRNPWDLTRTPGGSSGGAGAAVAAGLSPLAVGSDGGGSIRIPSSFCGVYGIKPTQGRVPRYGGFGKPAPGFFSQAGPMARTVKDAALLLQILSGFDRRDPACLRQGPLNLMERWDILVRHGVRGMRLAWSADLGYAPVDPEVVEITARAARVFQELGATVEEPKVDLGEPYSAWWAVFSTHAFTSYGRLLEERPEAFTPYARDVIQHGGTVMAHEYARALRAIEELQLKMDDLFSTYSLLLTPTLAVPAFPVGQQPKTIAGRPVHEFSGFFPFTFPFNSTGQPAASIPCGFSAGGLPIGLHIVGKREDEATVLHASAAFEEARPWAQKRPPVS